ncbi:Fic family protein [Mesorhizobium sp. M0243]|uniref:Fic family protein n=1 Tax=unclassified Mesorhizobium TaxID=325217 RepID=UPI0033398A85
MIIIGSIDLCPSLATSAVLGKSLHSRTAANLAPSRAQHEHLLQQPDRRPRYAPARHRTGAGRNFDRDENRRNLQLEAAAHVRVQAEIDRLAADGQLPEPASVGFLRWLHAEFYRDAESPMLTIKGSGREFVMAPGEWRSKPEHDVAIGRHEPPSSDRVNDFMQYFAMRYRFDKLGKAGRILTIPAAHHRFNYIHPFPDGNGRVSRLMSHAMALRPGSPRTGCGRSHEAWHVA